MLAKCASDQARPRRSEGGFTIIELLIALTVLIIGLTGIVQLQMSGVRASSYARHSTEASVLAEDKMEQLRTAPLVVDADSETVDASGNDDPDGDGDPVDDGFYIREWTIADLGAGVWSVEVAVTWYERGDVDDDHTVTLRTRRIQ